MSEFTFIKNFIYGAATPVLSLVSLVFGTNTPRMEDTSVVFYIYILLSISP